MCCMLIGPLILGGIQGFSLAEDVLLEIVDALCVLVAAKAAGVERRRVPAIAQVLTHIARILVIASNLPNSTRYALGTPFVRIPSKSTTQSGKY